MKKIEFSQFLPIPIEEAWSFFSSPANLNLITPKHLRFEIKSELPVEMHQGLVIRYIIRPFMHIPMKWVTKITALEEKKYFIDEQIQGPYSLWHHEHHFREVEGGVMMTDKLIYHIGWSLPGWIAGKVWIDRQIRDIFSFRQKKLESIFKK